MFTKFFGLMVRIALPFIGYLLAKNAVSFSAYQITKSAIFHRSFQRSTSSLFAVSHGGGDVLPTTWKNPAYNSKDIETWWSAIDRPLMTVGMKGVQQSHVNSLNELLNQHGRVIVKLASDKCDAIEFSNLFLSNELLKNSTDLIEIKSRALLFGRNLTIDRKEPIKVIPEGNRV